MENLGIKKISNTDFFTLVEEELAVKGKVRFRVKGISMLPLLRSNRDEVLLAACHTNRLQPGDICLFRYKGFHILHRFLYRRGDIFYFQGDNVVTRIEQCSGEDIVGKVEVIYREGQVSPVTSSKWKILIRLNRCKLRARMLVSASIPSSIKNLLKKYIR